MSGQLFLFECGQHFNLWKVLEPYPYSQNFYYSYLAKIFIFCITSNFFHLKLLSSSWWHPQTPWNHLQCFTHKLYDSCLMKQTLHIHHLFSLLLWCGIWKDKRRHLIPLSLKQTLCCLLLFEEPWGQKTASLKFPVIAIARETVVVHHQLSLCDKNSVEHQLLL